ncbi:hypothetical protein AUJ84_03770 [Candidatus Pacearchaeota archaeon CG1_02_32_132]|nr:MAG: hypothetical protein AUJ84_03770 [Candidatus Pacearchaeota archaeon CG1_02_32_132]
MLKDYFSLAFSNLKHRGLRSWLTMLGIFIGIAAVVSLISLGNGLESAVLGQFASLDADKLTVQNSGNGLGPPGATSIVALNSHDVDLIESVRGVDEVIPRLIRIVSVEYNKVKQFKYIADVPDDVKRAIIVDSLNVKIAEGRFLQDGDRKKVVLGSDFIDDSFDKPIRVGSNLKIQGENFEVIGILEKGSTFQINSVILMPTDDLKSILKIDDQIDLIVVQVENRDNLEQVSNEIERTLRKDRKEKLGEETFSVQTPLQSVSSISTVLNIINLIVSGIAAISLLIGGIGIANTMFTSVLERTKEIGIMKSIGAKNRDIMLIFIIESAFLGLVGGIIGAALGLALAFGISSLASSFLGGIELQVSISIPLIAGSILFSLALGLFFGLVPAYQASKLNPVEALRK